MQHDEMIWQVINHQFCSFKTTIGSAKSGEKNRRDFCRHEYSVTGLCNRSSCPLANSKYAVVRENEGKISLYLKTVERAHTPKHLWEKIPLSRNYSKALAQLDEHLAYFPKNFIHRNKQRLTKIHQYLIRMRKVELKKRAGASVKMTRIHRKVEQREERREKKALVAANIEKSIQTELVERLARGAYGDIYNFPEVSYQKALDDAANKNDDEENDGEYEIENEIESVLDEDDSQMIEYVEDFSDDEEVEDDEEDISETEEYSNASGEDESSILGDDNDKGDVENSLGSHERQRNSNKRKGSKKPELKRKRGARLEIEYEEEDEEDATEVTQRMESVAGMAW